MRPKQLLSCCYSIVMLTNIVYIQFAAVIVLYNAPDSDKAAEEPSKLLVE